jgi:hypothetical protein
MTRPLVRTRCATPRCWSAPGDGGTFCEACAARLAVVREAFQKEGMRLVWKRGTKRPPVCCALGCSVRRVPPAAFCSEHADAGYVEEED